MRIGLLIALLLSSATIAGPAGSALQWRGLMTWFADAVSAQPSGPSEELPPSNGGFIIDPNG